MEWISVKEQLPEDTNDVLAIDDENQFLVTCCFFSETHNAHLWEMRDDQKYMGNITHWMPLPKPPNI